MGYCPFLSFKQDYTTRSPSTISGTVYDDTGSSAGSPPTWNPTTDDVVYVPSLSSPTGSDQITYKTGAGGPGQFDGNGFFQCPNSTVCQMWDDKNNRCGLRSSDFIFNGSEMDTTAVVNIVRGVVGDYSERDQGKSLLEWTQDIIGITTERDSNKSMVTWLKDIIGITSERDTNKSLVAWSKDIIGETADQDDSRSLVSWAKDILGAGDDRDDTRSLISWSKDIIGAAADRDDSKSIVSWAKDILGAAADRDDSKSLISWAKDIIGITSEIGSTFGIGSLLKTQVHEHDYHFHGLQNFPHDPPTYMPILRAMILVAEFMANQDLDGDKGPGAIPGWTSIFGTDFMITADSDCPPAIKAIYEHPEWSDPGYSVTWSTYLAW